MSHSAQSIAAAALDWIDPPRKNPTFRTVCQWRSIWRGEVPTRNSASSLTAAATVSW